uniref:C-type lectin domain-containing protein n=1 Tax=Xiphophorus maculatus TaxID=8083 RepID=A0A3B5RA18_XIPMA
LKTPETFFLLITLQILVEMLSLITSMHLVINYDLHLSVFSTETNKTHKYHLIKDMKTWQEAQSYCRENHTDLISGTKQLQDEEVKKLMNSSDRSAYLGLFRDNWRWSDGNSFSFRHWNNDFNISESVSDQCGLTVFDDGGRWKNDTCDKKKPFIFSCFKNKRKTIRLLF